MICKSFAYYFIILIVLNFSSIYSQPRKIVALVGVRNEAIMIKQFLKAMSCYADAIIVLDDASTDNTVAIAEELAQECKVEKILKKTKWFRDEPGDRNRLLKAGRDIGGTHFIVLDADEMITANCMQNDFLRKKILMLKPGDSLDMWFYNLWRSINNYRNDGSVWSPKFWGLAFCDDGTCKFNSEFIHTYRIPALHGKKYTINEQEYGILHFQFVNWRNLLIKQAWYRCLERIREKTKSSREINARYAPSKNEHNLRLQPSKPEWFAGYEFFDPSIFTQSELWREKQVIEWFNHYGKNYFNDLDIWDIDWKAGLK